jgi:hypothetical protein
MTNAPRRRNWWRISIFAAIFLVSCFLFLIFGLVRILSFPGAGPPTATPEPAIAWLPFVGIATTALTAVSSLTGLVLSLRREKRDSRKSDLEVRQMELNLEKTTLEMETFKKARDADGKL